MLASITAVRTSRTPFPDRTSTARCRSPSAGLPPFSDQASQMPKSNAPAQERGDRVPDVRLFTDADCDLAEYEGGERQAR